GTFNGLRAFVGLPVPRFVTEGLDGCATEGLVGCKAVCGEEDPAEGPTGCAAEDPAGREAGCRADCAAPVSPA
ncbi:hypothetical protein, partial [Bifidobacterium angulatum]|uniref:hypothetical protein n=1 Tax=Bifidobacterium angulatum TaxID=1683 RepID=UPI003AB1E716